MNPIIAVIIAVATLIVGAAVGFLLGYKQRKKIAEAKIGSAELEAKRIVDEAAKEAENSKKTAVLEAKEQILKERNEAERELKEQRKEISRQEQRIVSKEEALDRKSENLDKKNEQLTQKLSEADDLKAEIETVLSKHLQELQRISGCTADEAKAELNGVTLESLVVAERVARAVKAADKNGRLNKEDFPLLCHVDEIIIGRKEVNLPWEDFTFVYEK